jgi:hypothetical protein
MSFNIEGVVLPNVPLSNIQLLHAAEKLKIKNMRGVIVRNIQLIYSEFSNSSRNTTAGSKCEGFHGAACVSNIVVIVV